LNLNFSVPDEVSRDEILALWLRRRIKLNNRSREAVSRREALDFEHGLVRVLENTMSSNSVRLMKETYFLWSDGF